ncbi:MAG: hypothetical protein BGO99_01015 [Nitrosospira sp. 56-18]|jgi:hypothetical protein|nr:MAG: hypothetical protein BGO99_01015 [Nitrosospira sp. 56-18]
METAGNGNAMQDAYTAICATHQCQPLFTGSAGNGNGAVIVAVPVVRIMKVAIHQVIDVISVRDGFVTAIRPMLMFRLMPGTLVLGRAAFGIG